MDDRLTMAIIIPTWRRPSDLERLLASLPAQERLPEQVIIACRPDDAETLAVIARWGSTSSLAGITRTVFVHEEGHLPPLVAALEVCEKDIICQLDDDAVPKPDWLLTLEDDFRAPLIGGICGKTINHALDGQLPPIMVPGRMMWFGRSAEHGQRKASGLYDADCFIGANMAFRTAALTDCVDMSLNGGSAISYETDIALNVKKNGYQVYYDPRVVVDHYVAPRRIEEGRGWNQSQCYWYAHNLTYICLKHLTWYGTIAFLGYFFLGGSWGCPGPVTYLLSLFSGRPASWSRQFVPAMKGRLAGLRSFLGRARSPGTR